MRAFMYGLSAISVPISWAMLLWQPSVCSFLICFFVCNFSALIVASKYKQLF